MGVFELCKTYIHTLKHTYIHHRDKFEMEVEHILHTCMHACMHKEGDANLE